MSLRDQLLAKGLASKKDVRRVDAQAKRDRKQQEGARQRKHVEQRQREAELAAARAAKVAEVRAARIAAMTERERTTRALQLRQIVTSNRLRVAGPRRYAIRLGETTQIVTLHVVESAAMALRRGDLAVVRDAGSAQGVAIVSREAAARLLSLAPELVVWWVRDVEGISSPEEAFCDRTWSPDLRARRASNSAMTI